MIGVCDPADPAMLDRLEEFHAKPTRFLRIERSELSA